MIRLSIPQDAPAIAAIDKVSFTGNRLDNAAERWVNANFAQYDKYRYFVSELDNEINGYAGWEIKGGFMRKTPVVELQRLAVAEYARGKGVGTELVSASMGLVKQWIKQVHPAAAAVRLFLWTKRDNDPALKLYGKFFPRTGGERNIYDSDEVMLVNEQPL